MRHLRLLHFLLQEKPRNRKLQEKDKESDPVFSGDEAAGRLFPLLLLLHLKKYKVLKLQLLLWKIPRSSCEKRLWFILTYFPTHAMEELIFTQKELYERYQRWVKKASNSTSITTAAEYNADYDVCASPPYSYPFALIVFPFVIAIYFLWRNTNSIALHDTLVKPMVKRTQGYTRKLLSITKQSCDKHSSYRVQVGSRPRKSWL